MTTTDHLVGILGGMGPAATADFYNALIRATPAARDQEHLRVVMWADPTVPDRIASALGQGADCYPTLLEGARKLRDVGATIAVMPCNTAHLYLDQLAAESGLSFLNMVTEAVWAVTERDPLPEVSGILATRATLDTRLYQDRLIAAGVRTVVPASATQQATDLAIAQVKSGDVDSARVHAESAVRSVADDGAEVVVLACTELPVALRDSDFGALPPVINPVELLARAVVRECRVGGPSHRSQGLPAGHVGG